MIRYVVVALGDHNNDVESVTADDLFGVKEYIEDNTGFRATVISEQASALLTSVLVMEAAGQR